MNSDHPDLKTLGASLSGELSDEQESRAVDHLGHCHACQRKLEQLAGGESAAWRRAVDVLRSEAQSQRSLGDINESRLIPLVQRSAGDSPVYPSQYAKSPADFAISFLQPSDRDDSIGRLDEFEILSVIGFGGMGIVLKGFQPELNRPVAVKVMATHLASVGAARQRFLREAQATAAVVHPNVMPILSVSEKASLPFLVMPYVACHSLQQRIDADGPLPIVDVLRISLQVAQGLAAAHAQGLVHRDVKPANILLERSVDRAMLTDFGLARAVDDATVTRSGVIAGTPQYMSPEQARGDAVDARSDLFSLGSVIYAMCVAHPPFRAETSYGILRKVTDHPPRPMQTINADVPAWLDRLTNRLMAKQAQDRYRSADEVAELLQQCLAHVQQPTVQPLPTRLRNNMHRRRLDRPLFILVAFLAIAAVTALWHRNGNVPAVAPTAMPIEFVEAERIDSAQADQVLQLSDNQPIDNELHEIEKEIDALIQRIES